MRGRSQRGLNVGSPYPIQRGSSSLRTLHKRVAYGGRKGRSAARRLAELEARIERSGLVHAMIYEAHVYTRRLLEPVERFMRGGA